MSTSLGEYIRTQRKALGIKTQGEFADRAGINRAHLSQIESGKIALPNADLRRRIAKGLGVSHLDILVNAGELAVEEIEAAGVQGVVEPGPKAHLQAVIDQHEWDWGQALHLGEIIRAYGNLPDAEQVSRIAVTYHNREPAPLTEDPYYTQGSPKEDDPTNSEG